MKHIVHGADGVHIASYANLVLLNRVYTQLEQRQWNRSRKLFLENKLKDCGRLVCHYCGNRNLKIKSSNRHEQATVDHVVPKSKGGAPWDHSNFVVSCNSCNKKKATLNAEEFLASVYIKRKRKSTKS